MTDKKDMDDHVNIDRALREAAEDQIGTSPDASTKLEELSSEKIIHELRVHQIELEIQNEELKRVQLELEASRAEFQGLYDFSPVGYFTLSQKGLIIQANLTGASLLGMPRPKLINLGFGHFVAPESEDQYYQHILNVRKQDGKQACDLTLKSDDGSSFYARLESVRMAVPVEPQGENSGGHLLRIAVSDITDSKRAEDAMRFSEERFRGMFESHSAIMLLVEPATGRIVLANKAAERFYGYTASRLVSMCIQDINILPPAQVETEMNLALHKLRNLFIFPHRLADGEVRTVQVHSSPIEHNEKVMLFSIIHDITESKRLEAERQEMERKLLHAQKLESLGVMAGGIAHDFNNLLQVVLGNLDLALDDIPPDSKARNSILNAIKASERSAELSGQMLTYAGSSLYLPKDIYLDDLLNKTKILLQSSISRHVALDFDICKTLPPIKGEADQIQRLICALVVNAAEAIGDNAGAVTLRTGVMGCDEAYLSHSRLEKKPESGRFIFLEVADTGFGMDAMTQHKLFDPFFTTKFWGRGLGMAEVMGIVRGHHGAILVNSELGKGTTIRVLFPAPKEAPAPSVQVMESVETQPAVSSGSAGRKTILVLDDEDLVRGLLIRRLEALGYDTISASDGDQGVSVFRERMNEIDLVMLDYKMPKVNGVEAFGELIRIKPDVKVILSSGYTEDVVMENFPGQRPACVLHKPYKMEKLKGELERLLGTMGEKF
jgi:two-component system, cell cycle sensor histidine kinase and response regulator CckA